jgi:hypothetical protein
MNPELQNQTEFANGGKFKNKIMLKGKYKKFAGGGNLEDLYNTDVYGNPLPNEYNRYGIFQKGGEIKWYDYLHREGRDKIEKIEKEKVKNDKTIKLRKVVKKEGVLDKVDNILSAPSRGLTYGVTKLLTGKGQYVDPSVALNIQNPVAKFAVDMVLDPTNLIGVGAFTKLGKLAKGAKLLKTVKTADYTKDMSTVAKKAINLAKQQEVLKKTTSLGKFNAKYLKNYTDEAIDAVKKAFPDKKIVNAGRYAVEKTEDIRKAFGKDLLKLAGTTINDFIITEDGEVLPKQNPIKKQNSSNQYPIVKNNSNSSPTFTERGRIISNQNISNVVDNKNNNYPNTDDYINSEEYNNDNVKLNEPLKDSESINPISIEQSNVIREQYPQKQKINIPLQEGTYLTREQQRGESGDTRYVDKKTGKLIGQMNNGAFEYSPLWLEMNPNLKNKKPVYQKGGGVKDYIKSVFNEAFGRTSEPVETEDEIKFTSPDNYKSGKGKFKGSVGIPQFGSDLNPKLFKDEGLTSFTLIKNTIAGPESGGKMTDSKGNLLKNPYGSASGKYQIIDSTWHGIEKQLGMRLDKRNLKDNEIVMDKLLTNYEKSLRSVGVPINPATLYAMHLKGNANWVRKAYDNPNLPTSAAFTFDEISQNKSYLQGKTLGQTLQILAHKTKYI